MTARVFVDTNILVYAHDADAGPKQKIAASRIKVLWKERLGRISTQVLQEFYVTVTHKLGKPLARSVAREIVRDYSDWAAQEQGCAAVLTEDLNPGQTVAGMRIVNPFLEALP